MRCACGRIRGSSPCTSISRTRKGGFAPFRRTKNSEPYGSLFLSCPPAFYASRLYAVLAVLLDLALMAAARTRPRTALSSFG